MVTIGPVEILSGIAVAFLCLYYYATRTFNFWKVRGVPGPEPIPFFGNTLKVLTVKRGFGMFMSDVYLEYKKHPMIGIFIQKEPALVIGDPDILKDIFIKDFSSFVDRGITFYEKIDPLFCHLFNLEPERWRPLRAKLSSIFTSGKLKQMFYLILECSENYEQLIDKAAENGGPHDCREMAAKFTTDVIGSCAFGLNINAIDDDSNEFRKMGKHIVMTDFMKWFRRTVKDIFPTIYQAFPSIMQDRSMNAFFMQCVQQTIKYRKDNKINRHDFIDLLLELKDNPEKIGDIELKDHLLVAQVFVFFVAGFETSATTISNTLHELAQNHVIQDRLREEIRETVKKNGGVLSYDSIKEMKYLDQVMKETLRKYPSLVFLSRRATTEYTFKRENVTIPKGTRILIPVFGMHRNPDIYPKPEVYDPERFSEENEKSIPQMLYLPFGEGPRNCIGARFGKYQTKLGVIKAIMNYKVDVCEKTEIPYPIDSKQPLFLTPEAELYVKFTKVQ